MSEDALGPVPAGADPDDYDRRRRRVMWAMPSGLYLLGSRAGPDVNLMTANWVTQVATQPKLVAVGVETAALTHRLISDGGAFAVSLLHRRDRAVTRKFVRPAVYDEAGGSLNGFEVLTAHTGAPIFAGSAAWLDCEVRHRLEAGSHTIFVGEVMDCAAPDGDAVEILRMEDTKMHYGG